LALAGLPATLAAAAIVSMQSGERLLGTISEISDEETLVLESPLLGQLKLPRSQIASVEQTPEPEPEPASAEPAPAEPAPPKPEVASATPPAPAPPPEKVEPEPAPEPTEPPPPEPTPTTEKVLKVARELKAPESWKGNLRVGLNLSEGDKRWSETFLRGNLVIDPKQSRNFYRFNGSYTYRETERNNGDTFVSTDRYDANFTYRRDLNERWFLQNSVGGRVDHIKGIDRELQELVGLGYRIKPSPKFELLFGAGGGIEDFEANRDDTRTGLNPVANAFQELTWRPFDRASIVQEFNYFINPEEQEQYNYLLRASFRYRITDLFGVEISFDKNFDNDVGNGNAQDDTRWRHALIVYF